MTDRRIETTITVERSDIRDSKANAYAPATRQALQAAVSRHVQDGITVKADSWIVFQGRGKYASAVIDVPRMSEIEDMVDADGEYCFAVEIPEWALRS